MSFIKTDYPVMGNTLIGIKNYFALGKHRQLLIPQMNMLGDNSCQFIKTMLQADVPAKIGMVPVIVEAGSFTDIVKQGRSNH